MIKIFSRDLIISSDIRYLFAIFVKGYWKYERFFVFT